MINKINKKILFLILIIVLVLVAILIFVCATKDKKNVLKVYETNEYGLMRDTEMISDEIFDDNGNLTHYKYKMKLEDGSTVEKTYDIKYTFDKDKRITRVAYDNNYIEVAYDSNNKISKLVNYIENDNNIKRKYEYSFTYNGLTINVSSIKSYVSENAEENYTTYENYIITENTINDNKYLKCILSHKDEPITEFLFKIEDKKINYSNIFSLLNIEFEGYSSNIPTIKNSDFIIELPIFNLGSILYQKDLTINSPVNIDCYYYYNKDNNILKYEMPNIEHNEMYFMYENINDKIYYRYTISSFSDANMKLFNLIKDKIYLNTNNMVYKIETLENKTLTEEQYQKGLNKFEKYFEENKQEDMIYIND